MNENDAPASATDQVAESLELLRERNALLERRLAEMAEAVDARVIRAELKAEAVRAGMVDLDGLKLIDPAEVRLSPAGEVEGAGALMNRLRRSKPWLFGAASTSSAAPAPPATPPRAKRAAEMTDAEYRAAKAELLRRR